MLKLTESRRLVLDWRPVSAGLLWLLALSWWLLLGLPLRRGLRSAFGGAARWQPAGPPTKPRRPKASPRRTYPSLPYSSAA